MSTYSLKPLPGSPDLTFHFPEPIQYFLIVKDIIETVSKFKHFFPVYFILIFFFSLLSTHFS